MSRNSRGLALLCALGFTVVACKKPDERAPGSNDAPNITAPPAAAANTPSVDTQTFPALDATTMKHPDSNPATPAKIELGHQLFFDARLSVDGSVSCYSCHQNEHGNGGGTPLAIGAKNKTLTRHSPTIWNVGFLPAFYWDGRSPTLEAQAKGAWGGGNMGVGADKLDAKAKEIAKIPGYAKQFAEVFPGREVDADVIAEALSTYERTLVCADTRYDRYARGDKSALTDAEKAGLGVFSNKGMCTTCHAPPHFSTGYYGSGAFFNAGVGTDGVPEDKVDVGRMATSKSEADWAAFKPPTLRNVSKSAPYFHDGSRATLREAVVLMASGGIDNKNKTPLLANRQLSEAEIDQLVAFLGALDCNAELVKPTQLP